MKIVRAYVCDCEYDEDCELCYEPPAPPAPLTWRQKAKHWFNRVILRRKPISLEVMDRTLRETYAPALADQINSSNALWRVVKNG